ncbi:FAD-binding protein [Klebsiella pneumoniae]|nr:FAD-binding protein [Klebsiella pneumoniae]
MYDTVKGRTISATRTPSNTCVRTGPEAILELEHMGLPFSRLDDGVFISARWRPVEELRREQAARTAAAADRTGHALLHTLYQQNLKKPHHYLLRMYALDLVKNQDGAVSVVPPCASRPAKWSTLKPAPPCWRPAAQAVSISPPPSPHQYG